jgi:LPS-assembly lipoprotein
MWWLERIPPHRVLTRFACIGALGALLTGCFQPLYGEHSFSNSPAIAPALAGVDVAQIAAPSGSPEARVAVEARNQLLFDLTGGGAAATPPTHRLTVRMTSSRLQIIVDSITGRPDVEDYGLNANYSLLDLKSGKIVLTSDTYARVSYDIPGQAQRFARARGLRDSENRAAKLIADNIRARLASYFVAGT